MKGNVFSSWLKEFCALVLIQTFQAFILALILTLIMMTFQRGEAAGMSSTVQTQATGVLAIIALTSISKIESVVKKIFGIESSFTDTSMKGGAHGMMGTIMAMKMAKNVLNNVPKIAKGAGGVVSARRSEKQAKIAAHDKLSRLDSRYGVNNSNQTSAMSGNPSSSSNTNTNTNTNTNASNDPVLRSAQEAFDEVKAEGFGPGDSQYDNALGALNSARAQVTPTSTQTSNVSNNNYDKYLDKKEKIMEEYNKKLGDIKSKRKEAVKNIFSGVAETGGAVVGGTIGAAGKAIWAAGTGDNDILQDATRGFGIGVGVGDKIGKGVTDVAFSSVDMVKSVSKSVKNDREENRRKIEEFEKELKKFNAGNID